jgi:uncharacterized protein YcfJ
MKSLVLAVGCLGVGAVTGCETIEDNPRTSGAVIGGLAGAGVGAAVGGDEHRTEGALIGGAAGAGGGYLVGDQIDKKNDREDDDADDVRRARARQERYDDDYYDYDSARPARSRDRYYDPAYD